MQLQGFTGQDGGGAESLRGCDGAAEALRLRRRDRQVQRLSARLHEIGRRDQVSRKNNIQYLYMGYHQKLKFVMDF